MQRIGMNVREQLAKGGRAEGERKEGRAYCTHRSSPRMIVCAAIAVALIAILLLHLRPPLAHLFRICG